MLELFRSKVRKLIRSARQYIQVVANDPNVYGTLYLVQIWSLLATLATNEEAWNQCLEGWSTCDSELLKRSKPNSKVRSDDILIVLSNYIIKGRI